MSEQVESLESEAAVAVDPWESSEAEALEDLGEDEAVVDDVNDAEELVADEAEADEPVEETEDTEAVEDDPVDDGIVEEPTAAVPWDGNPDTLQDELKPTHKIMLQGMNKKFVELNQAKQAADESRLKYEAKLEALASPQDAKPEGPPPLPDKGVSDEEWNAAVDARQEWIALDAARKVAAEANKVTEEQEAVVNSEAETRARFESIAAFEGMTDEIAQGMADVMQANPYWQEQASTSDEGANALYKLVKHELDVRASEADKAKAATKAADLIKAQHAAGKRSVSRPKAASSSPGEAYAAKGFEAAEAQALAEFEKLK